MQPVQPELHLPQPQPPVSQAPASPTLSSLFSLYTTEHSPNWTDKSRQEFEGQFRLLLDIIGDRDISAIDRAACIICRDTLLKLPPGFSKKKAFKGKTIEELAGLGLPGLHGKTVNKYMTLLASLFKWGIKHGYYKGINPAEGLSIELSSRPDEERKAYDVRDLQKVVDNLPISKEEPEKLWVPLIAMFSGLRLEEVCQLRRSDISKVDEVWGFDINDNGGRKLKTKSSRRFVPVHPLLINLGFLQYIDVSSPPDEGNLWGLAPGKWGFGKKVTNWYSRFFNRQFVTDDPLKCFHSFRHTVADTLKQAGVLDKIVSEILGHTDGSITTGRYGKRYKAQVLMDAMQQLDYQIDLSRLEEEIRCQMLPTKK